ncbi:MAG TPA: DNA topology modulation protein FlaR [Methylomirabilota bacterium]|jgi:adenylate kinase family enzyme|nr:DNA topology modulation protein FlaR [Methylomirabilota bacterium]
MSHRKIHIIGGPGSGKSFVGAKLSAMYALPVFDLDDIFWDRRAGRYGVRAPEDERDRALATIVDAPAWIIEGVYYGWLSRSFEAADRIVVLTPSVTTRDWRICKRFLQRRAGLVPSKQESLSDLWRLIKWNHRYDADHLRQARLSIGHLRHKIVEARTFGEVVRALTH